MASHEENVAGASADNTTHTAMDEESATQIAETKASPQEHQEDCLTEKPHPKPIPRSHRRGLLGRLTIIPEVANPYAYRNGTKWLMTIIVSLAEATSSFGSSIFYRK
jgi:hypothetical protein